MDRFDLQIEVPRLAEFEIDRITQNESSVIIRKRVEAARVIQRTRFAGSATSCNAGMNSHELREYCEIDNPSKNLLRQAMQRFSLSARAYTRILKLARTIADLEGLDEIQIGHVAEAIQYRSLDRKGFV